MSMQYFFIWAVGACVLMEIGRYFSDVKIEFFDEPGIITSTNFLHKLYILLIFGSAIVLFFVSQVRGESGLLTAAFLLCEAGFYNVFTHIYSNRVLSGLFEHYAEEEPDKVGAEEVKPEESKERKN